MSINFNSRTGGVVGTTGKVENGYIQNLQARHTKDELTLFHASSSLPDYCLLNGYNTNTVMNYIENDMGYQNGSLSFNKSIVSNDNDHDLLMLDPNGNFVEFNMDSLSYSIKSEKNIVEEAGLKMTQYDKLSIDQGGFTFYKFVTSGLGDGQKDYVGFFRQRMDNLKWGATSVIYTEVSPYDNLSQF